MRGGRGQNCRVFTLRLRRFLLMKLEIFIKYELKFGRFPRLQKKPFVSMYNSGFKRDVLFRVFWAVLCYDFEEKFAAAASEPCLLPQQSC